MSHGSCSYCQSTQLVEDVIVYTPNGREAGLAYLVSESEIAFKVSPAYCQVCNDCGSIERMYVKDTKLNWKQEKSHPSAQARLSRHSRSQSIQFTRVLIILFLVLGGLFVMMQKTGLFHLWQMVLVAR